MADDQDAEKIEYICPAYACDEKKKDGFIRVIVAAKNLTTSREIMRQGKLSLPKVVKRPSNAKLEVVFENQSFCMTLKGDKGGMKGKNIQLKVKQLPHEIDGDNSFYEVEDDRVLLFLCKLSNKSWYPELDNGLETAEEED